MPLIIEEIETNRIHRAMLGFLLSDSRANMPNINRTMLDMSAM